MKKILAFSFFPAFTPVSNGGESRIFNFYRSLSRTHQVTLLSSTHQDAQEERVFHGVNFIERRIPKDNAFNEVWATLSKVAGKGDLSGPALAACAKFPGAFHNAYLEEYASADIIIHDFPFTIDYDVFAGFDSKLRVYNSQNCESVLYSSLHSDSESDEIPKLVEGLEKKILEISDLVFYCGDDDLVAFHELAPDAKFESEFVPNGMTPVRAISSKDSSDKVFSTVFMGSGHLPNQKAALTLANDIAPLVPEVQFNILGTCLPEGKYSKNVIRHGRVSDALKDELLSNSHLALNPMSTGSGSNIKVLEYLARGLPVLSTDFGVRGLSGKEGEHFLVSSLEAFGQAIRDAASTPARLTSLGEAGLSFVNANYTWDAIADRASKKIVEVHGRSKTHSANKLVTVLNDYDSFAGIGGGATRTRGLYAAVSESSTVVFLCFSSDRFLRVDRYDENTLVIAVPKTAEHVAELQYVNAQSHISCDDIVAGRHCTLNPLLVRFYQTLRGFSQSVVIEHPFMVGLPVAYADRFVYSSQNNELSLKSRLFEYHPLRDSLIADVAEFERKAVELSAVTVAVSDEDADSLLRNRRTAGPAIVVRNGSAPAAPIDTANARQLQGTISARSVVFLGSAHMPNVDSANYLVEHIAPNCPDVEFHLIGSVCSSISAKSARNVRLWGVLDDSEKSAVMQACSIAINPMMSGSGSNVKLADYLANGLFVVTTVFGQRGYPEVIQDHIDVVALESFPQAILSALSDVELRSPMLRELRQSVFDRCLSMQALAADYVHALQNLSVPKKRVLFVTYRYTSPAMGGAEMMMEQLLRALGRSNMFQIDVVAPEVSSMHSRYRFSENYYFDSNDSAFINMHNVRFARFPIEQSEDQQARLELERAWQLQPSFERIVSDSVKAGFDRSGLTWGWSLPEGKGLTASRWAYATCGLYVEHNTEVRINGFVHKKAYVTVLDNQGVAILTSEVEGQFVLSFFAPAGEMEITTSIRSFQQEDPRPLAFIMTALHFDGVQLDISNQTLVSLASVDAQKAFEVLAVAAEGTRDSLNVKLSDLRGPFSEGLEHYVESQVSKYHLVITHNHVFRPAIVAVEAAKRHDVPVVIIPHAHLDDDFYHFPDLNAAAKSADLVLASPLAACEFYRGRGANVSYFPAGIDTKEVFHQDDVDAFRSVFSGDRPFLLVLGRKSGAKGYKDTIASVEKLNAQGQNLHVVLIGPDDDGIPVLSQHATYLGKQPRNVVRGALMSCLSLVNMSSSESFGIVLLEAWLAGKPVIANNACAAFHDMAINGVNAILTDAESLAEAIKRLISDPALCTTLAENGRGITQDYDWSVIGDRFINICGELMT
ncbi:glycosyltransferase [Pseudomonas fluorescens]|uniref:glycosyltransferase n=1 Tax=Pseudomonas fluorescens TaxID=294 RepID=UPI0005AC8C94|nr:glycosyltransferase [Pseudomonas fluorescens]